MHPVIHRTTAPKNNTKHLRIIAEKHFRPPILQLNRTYLWTRRSNSFTNKHIYRNIVREPKLCT